MNIIEVFIYYSSVGVYIFDYLREAVSIFLFLIDSKYFHQLTVIH